MTLCGENGEPAERYLYDPYGLPSFFDGSWSTRGGSVYGNAVLFTGRLWHPGTYTYDYRHREHSPYLGRFLRRDPAGAWGDSTNGGNPYAYAANTPYATGRWAGDLSNEGRRPGLALFAAVSVGDGALARVGGPRVVPMEAFCVREMHAWLTEPVSDEAGRSPASNCPASKKVTLVLPNIDPEDMWGLSLQVIILECNERCEGSCRAAEDKCQIGRYTTVPKGPGVRKGDVKQEVDCKCRCRPASELGSDDYNKLFPRHNLEEILRSKEPKLSEEQVQAKLRAFDAEVDRRRGEVSF